MVYHPEKNYQIYFLAILLILDVRATVEREGEQTMPPKQCPVMTICADAPASDNGTPATAGERPSGPGLGLTLVGEAGPAET